MQFNQIRRYPELERIPQRTEMFIRKLTGDRQKMNFSNSKKNGGERYLIIIKSWQDNWEKLSEYFQYTPAIHKLSYKVNTVDGYHRQIRKVTKNKGMFPRIQLLKSWFILHTVISVRNGPCISQLGDHIVAIGRKVWRPV